MDKMINDISPGLFIWQTTLFLAIILPIIALIDIIRNEFNGNNKLIWLIVIIFFNLFGVLLYFIFSRDQKIKKTFK